MNLKKLIGWCIGIAVIVGVIGYNAYHEKQKSITDKKRVYAILPLTGRLANPGKDFKRAIESAFNKIPNPAITIEFIDSEWDAAKTVSITNKILLTDTDPLIINFTSNTAHVLIPQLNGKGFVMSAETLELDDMKQFQNFERFSGLSKEGIALAANFLSRHKKIGIINSNDVYGTTGVKYFKEALKGKNIELVRYDFENNTISTRDLVQKMLLQHPNIDAVWVSASGSSAFINIFRELKRFQFTGSIVAIHAFAQQFVIDELGKEAEDIVFLTQEPHLSDPRTPAAKEFKLFAKQNQLYPNFSAIEGYDIVNLINDMAQKGIPFTQDAFNQMRSYDGVAGKLVFLSNGNSSYPSIMATIKNGKIIPVEESEEK